MENIFTKSFNKISKNDVDIAGGKGASLGEMINNDIPVPFGFVVLSSTFDKFLEITNINIEIDNIVNKIKHSEDCAIENASKIIQSLILKAKIPSEVAKEIKLEFKKLNTKYVAVRSSATAEDSVSDAWAGQLDSFLNTTEDNLLENVKKCWASLFTPRAIFYRFEKKLNDKKISVAVVIQKMVNSDVSGIAFSVHPVTEDRNQIIIEAGYGLGEAIVSGQITPDSYVVSKDNLKILDRNISTQTRGIYRSEDNNGSDWKNIIKAKRDKQCLSNKQIIELSELIIKIENYYNFPCDVEWAMKDGIFYIVQSRPITTLKENTKNEATKKVEIKLKRIKKILLNKEHSREYSLAQVNSYCEIIDVVKKETGCIIDNELFLYNPKTDLVETYHKPEEIKNLFNAVGYLAKKKGFVDSAIVDFVASLAKIKPYLEKEKKVKNIFEFKELYKLFSRFYLGIAYVWVLPLLDYLPQKIRDKAMELREKTENYSSQRDKVLIDNLKIIYPELGDLVKFLLIEEIDGDEINKEAIFNLQERAKGYIYYKNKIYQGGEFKNFFKKNNLELDNKKSKINTNIIKGNIAYKGKINGLVKLVFTEKDLVNVNKGDIIVSPMTRPEFLPAMKKAVAFITDEGGVTCHAAIVTREMKKPCIIGTKVATQVLNNGDLVEVDADNGVVKILKRK